MKYGAVCSPGSLTNPSLRSNFYVQADLLYRMRATTARISMFHETPGSRRYTDEGLNTLLGAGLTEMIINSSPTADEDLASLELQLCVNYIDAHPNTLFVFELGNEPDISGESAFTARYHRLTTIKNVKPTYAFRNDGTPRSNLLWAINMPSPNVSAQYFNEFVIDNGDGLGNLLTGANRPDIATVHCYGDNTLCRSDPPFSYKVVDWIRGWNGGINIKVTEAGISTRHSDRPRRYVEFAEKVALPRTTNYGGGGNLDSVCFYGLPELTEAFYEIDGAFADAIGSRVASNYCA